MISRMRERHLDSIFPGRPSSSGICDDVENPFLVSQGQKLAHSLFLFVIYLFLIKN